MKKILFVGMVGLIIAIIYYFLCDKKIYYVDINDGGINNSNYNYADYISDYFDEIGKLEKYVSINNKNNRIIDLIRMIEQNQEYEGRTFQNILIKCDLLTLNIGYNDFILKMDFDNKMNLYQNINEYLSDLEKLFKILRKYDKEKIVFLGYFNIYDAKYSDAFVYLNNKVAELSDKYHITYIKFADLSDYIVDDKMSIEGEHHIFNEMRYELDNIIKK